MVTDRSPTLILKANDIHETVGWYRRLGFEVELEAGDEPGWARVSRDDLVLDFLADETPWDGPPAMTGSLYVHPFSVESVLEEARRNGIHGEWGVEEKPWGSMELTLQDPNGYFLTFSQPA